MSIPKISIITPVFNNEKDIVNCIRSVANQTYKNIEHIIIDGGSKDRTVELFKSYSEKYTHIIWISEKDNGIYDAMNKGIDLSTGDYLLFLGSDDVFYYDTILNEILEIKDITSFDFIYGKALFKTKNSIYGREVDLNILKTENISHQAILYKKSIFDKLGKYGNTFKVSEDYIFNIKCFQDDTILKKFVDKILVVFNDTATSSFYRDGFLKYRLTYFDNLTFAEQIKKIYYYYRPDWFIPSKWFRINK